MSKEPLYPHKPKSRKKPIRLQVTVDYDKLDELNQLVIKAQGATLTIADTLEKGGIGRGSLVELRDILADLEFKSRNIHFGVERKIADENRS